MGLFFVFSPLFFLVSACPHKGLRKRKQNRTGSLLTCSIMGSESTAGVFSPVEGKIKI